MLFTIKDRVIKCRSSDLRILIGDNNDYIALFAFDSEWSDVTKTARFIHNDTMVESIITNNQCKIPLEVLKEGILTVGVYSSEMCTTPCEVYIRESIKEKTGTTPPPSEDIYLQLLSILDEIKQQCVTKEEVEIIVKEYVDTHKQELKGDKGDKGEPGYTPQRGVDYWTSEDISSIENYIDTQIGGALNGSY